MKLEVSKLIGPALDWAVAKAEGYETIRVICQGDGLTYIEVDMGSRLIAYSPSTQWELGGPIIQRKLIGLDTWQRCATSGLMWAASFAYPVYHPTEPKKRSPSHHRMRGVQPLVAAMRCYVSSAFGDFVDMPDPLYKLLEI